MNNLLGLSGYGGVGKDAFARLIQYSLCKNVGDTTPEESILNEHSWWMEGQSGWRVKKFAGKLKQIASLLTGISVDEFESQDFKKTTLGREWATEKPYHSKAKWVFDGETYADPMTGREFLQRLGTDAIRNNLHPNAWVNALFADWNNTSKWIITDVRFPNEAKAIKDRGGILVRINRPGYGPVNGHESETALDGWEFDYIVDNKGNINYLHYQANKFIDIWLKN